MNRGLQHTRANVLEGLARQGPKLLRRFGVGIDRGPDEFSGGFKILQHEVHRLWLAAGNTEQTDSSQYVGAPYGVFKRLSAHRIEAQIHPLAVS